MKKIYLVLLQDFCDETLATHLDIDCYESYEEAYLRFNEWVSRIGKRGHIVPSYNHVKNLCTFHNIDGTEGILRVIEKSLN